MRRKNYAEAIPVFQKCIELAPANASFYHELSQAFIRLGYPVSARKAVLNAIQRRPHEATLYNTLGVTYAMQGNIPKAIQAFLKAIEFAPEVPDHHFNLAKLYKKAGNDKLAEAHYQMYKRLKGKTPQ